MKKIYRKVFIEFNGFKHYKNHPVLYKGKLVKLSENNFNKMLNLLINKMISSKKDLKSGFVDISSKTLKKVVDDYRPYLSELVVNGYLERDYYVGNYNKIQRPTYFQKQYRKTKPFGYRFTEAFKNWISIKQIIFIPLTEDEIVLRKKYDKENKTKSINTIQFNPETIKRLKKDYSKCSIGSFEVQKTKYQRSKFIDLGKWVNNQKELFKWDRGDISFCLTTNRLYTNFTRLSSHVRLNNILLDNESIREIDISNSFPLLLAVLCVRKKPEIGSNPDFVKYCTLVKSGLFYKELMKGLNSIRHADAATLLAKLKVKKGQKKQSTMIAAKKDLVRDVVKVLFQKYLNSAIDSVPFIEGFGNSLINDYMQYNYPEIHEIVLDLKANSKVYNELVEIESRLIFDIIEDCYKNDNDILLITCHDALYTSENKIEILRQVFDEHISALFNEIPGQVETGEEDDNNYDDFIDVFALDDDDLLEKQNYSDDNMDYDDKDEEDFEDEDDFWESDLYNSELDLEQTTSSKSEKPERTYAEKLDKLFDDFKNEK